jgi:uncharacterized repeat protein (TIGR01451 family)
MLMPSGALLLLAALLLTPPRTVRAAPTTHFLVSVPASVTVGSAFSFTVTALDALGNPDPTYSGPVSFSSSDPAASLPAASPLTNGVGTFSATFGTAGTQTITATGPGVAAITVTITTPGALAGYQSNVVQISGLSGTFTLTVNGQTTGALPFDATAAQVQAALQALSTVGAGNVTVTGDIVTHFITFAGSARGPQALSGAGTGEVLVFVVLVTAAAPPVNQVETVALSNATGGTYTLTFNGQTTGALAFNAPVTQVQAALQGLSTVGFGNVTVTGSPASYTITFVGALGGAPQPAISASSQLTGPAITGTSTTIAVRAAQVLTVTKTAPATVTAGNTITYTVTSTATAALVNPTLIDQLPAGTTVVSVTPPAGWTCPPSPGPTVDCLAFGVLSPGTYTATIQAQVSPSVAAGTLLSNTASVSSDGMPAINSTATTTVQTSADLAVVRRYLDGHPAH